jgi:hypothetical protein
MSASAAQMEKPFPQHSLLFRKDLQPFQTNIISRLSHHAQLIESCSVIVWEELAAANKTAVECCEKICRQIKQSNHPFGGIPFIALGDFHQVPPVIKSQGETTVLHASIKSSTFWPKFSIHSLLYPH